MPKRKGTFLEKKKNGGTTGDFMRKSSKVGRKVARHATTTSTKVTAGQIGLKEQLVDRSGVVSRRGKTLEEHLAQLSHHNEKVRIGACAGVGEIFRASPRPGGPVEVVARALGDESRRVRSEARHAIMAILDGGGASFGALAGRLGAALAAFDLGQRLDAASFLASLLVDRRHPLPKRTLVGPLAAALRTAKPAYASTTTNKKGKAYRVSLLRIAAVLLGPGQVDDSGPYSFAPADDVVPEEQHLDHPTDEVSTRRFRPVQGGWTSSDQCRKQV